MNTYLFDFDGTLVDSMPTYARVMRQILDENHVSYGEDIIKIITPLGTEGTAEYYVSLGVPLTKEQIIATMREYLYVEYRDNIQAKANVIETLAELKKRGASLNVLTASSHITLDACLKRLGIFDWFDNVWSCDDFQTSKTNPEIYHMAAQRLGKKVEEIMFLDDNLNADQTAKRAGMQVCGVYDPSSDAYVEQIKAATDHYIYDFTELLNI